MGITKFLCAKGKPKANGQIERFFRTLKSMLSAMAICHISEWDKYLAHVIYAYNCSLHRTVGNTPYYLMFGRDPESYPHHGLAEATTEGQIDDPMHQRLRWSEAKKFAHRGVAN